MTNGFVLIHSPLVGPMTWLQVAAALQRNGRHAIAPSLAGQLDDGPPYYQRLAASVASAIDAAGGPIPVALVAHSGAGALIPSVVDASRAPVSAAIFVDAILPHPGRCWMETVPAALAEDLKNRASAGILPPWNEWFPSEMIAALLPDEELRNRFVAELPRLPMCYFEERAPETQSWQSIPCGYLQLSSPYANAADWAASAGWHTRLHPSDHLSMLTQSCTIADIIQSMVDRIVRS
jgi:hypothetical protein